MSNERKLTQVETECAKLGLAVGTDSPGDGLTRYRFFHSTDYPPYANYSSASGIHTALGRKAALDFLKAYGLGLEAGKKQVAALALARSFRPYPIHCAKCAAERGISIPAPGTCPHI